MDASALKNFECPVCMDYFQKPIFQCPTGHSVCSNCKLKLLKCPYCLLTFTNTRNFAFENILSSVKVECKNEDCTKIIPLHNYSQHIDVCPFSNIKCKHLNCTWSDNKLLVNEHIKTIHTSLCVQKLEKLQSHQFSIAYIEHNDVMFMVRRYVAEEKFLIWTAEPTIGVSVNNLYLVVKIVSATGASHTLRQPIGTFKLDAKEKSITCLIKSKAKGCEFQLSIEDENKNDVDLLL